MATASPSSKGMWNRGTRKPFLVVASWTRERSWMEKGQEPINARMRSSRCRSCGTSTTQRGVSPRPTTTRDEREIEALVLGVEGDVDEDVAGGLPRRPRDSHPSPQPLLLARRSLLFDPARRSAAVLVVHGDGVSDPLGIMSREAIRPCRLDYRERARRGADDREGLLHFGVPSTP